MFTYADLNKIGYDHFLFNTGYFTVFRNLLPKDKVELYSESSHFEYIKHHIDTSNLEFKPIYVLSNKKNKKGFIFSWLYKNFYDFIIIYKILKSNRKQSGKFIFFATMPVRSMFYLLFWHSLFFSKSKIILTFHGEIEFWFLENKNITQRLHSLIFKQVFKYKNSSFHLFLPNDFIKANVQKEPLLQQKNIFSIWNLLQNSKYSAQSGSKIILGHIGSTEHRKNSALFFDFANKLFQDSTFLTNKVSFLVAGRYKNDFDNIYNPSYVQLADQEKIKTLDYFNEMISSIQFSVIFIRNDEYIYRESATILESLKFYKPIIGLSHPYFNYLETEYGRIGIFEPDIDALLKRVKAFFEQDYENEYKEFINNIALIHQKNSLHELTVKLKVQLEQAQILPS